MMSFPRIGVEAQPGNPDVRVDVRVDQLDKHAARVQEQVAHRRQIQTQYRVLQPT